MKSFLIIAGYLIFIINLIAFAFTEDTFYGIISIIMFLIANAEKNSRE